MLHRMSSLNFSYFLHMFSFLLADKAEMENFLLCEFLWTDSTGNALVLVEDDSV